LQTAFDRGDGGIGGAGVRHGGHSLRGGSNQYRRP
jgi:hypothetical protein